MSDATIIPEDEPFSLPSERTMCAGAPDSLGRIDHYDLLRKLGGGGFGVVYLARDTTSGVDVAIKTLHPLLKHNEEEMDLLRDKFALVSRLAHPNIATALVLHRVRDINLRDETARQELKLSSGDSVMVMRYAPGVTLSKWRRQFPGGIVPFGIAIEIGRQIAAALDYAHGEKIVHRDVKPSNIMVETLDGGRVRARILDFGLAAEIRSSISRVSTETGDTSGTRPYMAPEQWLGRNQDGGTDQYALACVLRELLAGAPPFAAVFETGDPAVMMAAVERRTPDPVAGLPCAVNAALSRALSKDSAARFPSCAAFVEALAGATSANPPRRRFVIGLAASVLLVLVGLLAVIFAPVSSMEPPSEPIPVDIPVAPAMDSSDFAENQEKSTSSAEGSVFELPPPGASRADLEDAQALLEARRDTLVEQGFAPSDPERAPVEEALATLETRIEKALAKEERKARETERADRRAAAQRAADLRTLEDLKRAVARRVSSLDGTWKEGEFAKKRKAIADAQKKLENCKDAASLPRAKELRGDIYDAADWIEANTPAYTGLVSTEMTLSQLAARCEAASASSLAATSFRKAEHARKDAEALRDANRYEDAAAGYAKAKKLFETALSEAQSAQAEAEVDSARTYEKAKMWTECLAAAEKALEWSPNNETARTLKTTAEKQLKTIADVQNVSQPASQNHAELKTDSQPKAKEGTGQVASTVREPAPNESNSAGDVVSIDLGNGVALEMVYCPAVAAGFWMGRFEVTQAQWEQLMGSNPSHFKGERKPVESVDWSHCLWFARKLNELPETKRHGLTFRLPTENEWEMSCRAGAPKTTSYGLRVGGKQVLMANLSSVARYGQKMKDGTIAVGSLLPNAWGLYDMHGNVWEWTQTTNGRDYVGHGGCFSSNAKNCTIGSWNGDTGIYSPLECQGLRLAATDKSQISESNNKHEALSVAVRETTTIDLGGGVKLEMVPCHDIAPNFLIGKYEVTQEQWLRVMGTSPLSFNNKPMNPIGNISWNECQAFIRKLNEFSGVKASGLTFRLPMEKEWESACRAGAPKSAGYCKLADGTQISSASLSRVAWFRLGWKDGPIAVGCLEPNAWGLYDMHGNVWEWIQVADGDRIMCLGGGFNSHADTCAASFRSKSTSDADTPIEGVGFRLAADENKIGRYSR